jgi:aryl-alcohol dehydrogenase-like predicted oxidoreductase
MEFTNLGRTGLKVSRLCLGTMNFGPETTEPDSHAIMTKALELGINFWDTADVYGWKKWEGYTESILGRWFASNRAAREQIVIATKFQGDMWAGPNGKGASAKHIRAACDDSLRRMQLDYIDLYQMHHINRDTPWEEIYQAYDLLVQQGKVLYFGSSNYAGWHIAQAQEEARKRNFLGLVSEQSKFSLLCRQIEMEVLPACRHYGVGVIPWSPLASGLLAGISSGEGKRRKADWVKPYMERHPGRVEKWETFCKAFGQAPADVALAWTLQTPGVTAPIIGPRTMDQLTGSLRALEIKFTPEQLQKIDEIWPPAGDPGTQAGSKSKFKLESPEAFAW